MNIERHYDGTNFITGLRAIAVLMVFLIHSGGGGFVKLTIFSIILLTMEDMGLKYSS
jgi:peptidoglycan/LPS O-acetylase OafA/YrhL